VQMMGGESILINIRTFANDMRTFHGRDDILTLLVHLGYLSYDESAKTVSIPNREIAVEYASSIGVSHQYSALASSLQESRDLLRALVEEKDESKVAEGIEKAHYNIPAVKYNDENSLACTIQLALYAAIDYYFVEREVPAGKGIADVVLVPRTLYKDKPAAIIELKWNQDADGAIEQIKEKNYPAVLRDYHGELVLAGINYDKNDKVHTCRIEAMRI